MTQLKFNRAKSLSDKISEWSAISDSTHFYGLGMVHKNDGLLQLLKLISIMSADEYETIKGVLESVADNKLANLQKEFDEL